MHSVSSLIPATMPVVGAFNSPKWPSTGNSSGVDGGVRGYLFGGGCPGVIVRTPRQQYRALHYMQSHGKHR